MSNSWRFIINDLADTHKENFTDSKIGKVQILYWCILVANRLRKDAHVKNDSGLYLSTFSPVPVLLDALLKNRQYIELPEAIYDQEFERSIKYITYNFDTCCCAGPAFAQVSFSHTTAMKSKVLYWLPYTKPTTKNPFFYRVGNRLYFLGTECITVKDVEIQLLTAINPLEEVNIDDDIPLSAELISVLRYEVVALARYSYMIPNERKNLGDDISGSEAQIMAALKNRQQQQQPQQE